MISSSKSIGGYGFPMAILLIKDQYDIWSPGEHNGTFRGNQVAFIAAKAALEYREKYDLASEVKRKSAIIEEYLKNEIIPIDDRLTYRGIGMIWGIDFAQIDPSGELTHRIASKCFDNKLIIERAGRHDVVLKIMPALTIEDDVLLKGLASIKKSIIDILI